MAELVGVDVGGTFTDVIAHNTVSGRTCIHKVPTTPQDPSVGVLAGIAELCERNSIELAQIDQIFHGTTIATNAVLEHKGCRSGMITTSGFRDICHIGRHQRPQHYSIMQEIPWQNRPLVQRRFRKVVNERIVPPDGRIEVPLDEDAVRTAARELKDAGIESVAICFLFSYLNPRHEDRAKEIVLEEHPDAYVTTSSEISPQFREFERFTTASINAFVGPLVRDYVGNLRDNLSQASATSKLHIMLSNGGVGTAPMVCDAPVRTLLSGPAAGVLCGTLCSRTSTRQNLITFDVGGTSADIAVIQAGQYSESSARETSIAGYPVLVPMIDIHTIGAGGGSIAYVDEGGGFRVGPRSSGAQPGPAAYDRGGTEPTVTDAHLVLGRLDPDNFLGGEMRLNTKAARQVIDGLAEELALSPEQTASGILTIVNSNMANAIRSRTVQKGMDPRNFSLVAFGGAGPLHGVEVAAMLGIPEVIVPEYPGIGSAVGLLTSDLKYDLVGTQIQTSDSLDLPKLNDRLNTLQAKLVDQFRSDGIEIADVEFRRFGELRYAGQGYELRVEFPQDALTGDDLAAFFDAFHARHELEYGHAFPNMPVEIVNVRMVGNAAMDKIQPLPTMIEGDPGQALVAEKDCMFLVAGNVSPISTRYYQRDRLPVDSRIDGPAIVLQKDSTTVIPPGCTFERHSGGDLMIRIETGTPATLSKG
jgi:N-methylhydantoinase A/oxoprolinase/acetone carboxylase beta subunit